MKSNSKQATSSGLPMRRQYQYLTKDFVETREGLLFALVAEGTEHQRVLGCLRYRRTPTGFAKLSTQSATETLNNEFPNYVYYSVERDVWLPGIPLQNIIRHFIPSDVLALLHEGQVAQAAAVFSSLGRDIGITGSRLIGADTLDSDIDLVVYGTENFQRARTLMNAALVAGTVQPLSDEQWEAAYQRRGSMALSFDEYRWHEVRKCNKCSVGGIKVDLSCVAEPRQDTQIAGKKMGQRCIRAKIVDDRYSFTSPAVYEVDHDFIQTIVVFTATYVGQAKRGEMVEALGTWEQSLDGSGRLIVGASREAVGEYLKVLSPGTH